MQTKLASYKLFKTIKTKTYVLESQIIKKDLNHKNCDYIPFTKYFKRHSHLNRFEIKPK